MRKSIKRMREDTASMVALRDNNSFFTHYTDNFSKLSRVFSFDLEVFASQVYQRVFRNSMKDNIRSSIHTSQPSGGPSQTQHYQKLEQKEDQCIVFRGMSYGIYEDFVS